MKRTVLGFDGGMNEVADSKTLKPNVCTDIVNYETKDFGKITKRVDDATFEAGLNSQMIVDTKVFSGGTIKYIPQEPFYPPRMPLTSYSDVLYPVFGVTSGGTYELVLFYRTAVSTWTYEIVDITGVTYNVDSVMRITYDRDRMLVADGQNKSHFSTIDQDGAFIHAINEIPRPLNKPTGVETTTYNPSLFQENIETGSYINYCGVYRYWYTFVTDSGDESNPSPASEWIDMQFFKKDDDDLDEREVKTVTITNLEITDNASSILEQIKYFRIYREELRYTNGIETRTPLFIKEIIVSDKDGSNQFTDTIAILSGDTTVDIDYENDSSPKGNDICAVGGSTVLGGIQTRLEFPFTFDHYREVTLTNPNARSYVNGVVRAKFDDITNQGVLPEVPDWDYLTQNLDKVRFFDNDLTTPLNTVYEVDSGFDWSGFTDKIVNGDFDPDSDWTKGGSWTIGAQKYASNSAATQDALTQTVAPLTQNNYFITQMDFKLTGTADTDGLYVEDYYVQKVDGEGFRNEAFIIKAGSTAFVVNKTSASTISYLDNVAAYGSAIGGVTQDLTNPEMSADTNWTPEAGSLWTYTGGTFINNSYTSRGYLQGDTANALVNGTKYLVTLHVNIKNPSPNDDMLEVLLGTNKFGISGQGDRYISRVVEATADSFFIDKIADGTCTLYYARVVEIVYATNSITSYIKIPEIPISDSKTIYQVWCEQGGSDGVNDAEWRDPKYGEFIDYSDATEWATQETFGNIGVETVDTIICSPMQIIEKGDEAYNRADVNTNGVLNNATFNTDNICLLPALSKDLTTSENTVQIDTITRNSGAEYTFDPRFNLPFGGVYCAGFVSIDGTNADHTPNYILDIEFENSGEKHMVLYIDDSGDWYTSVHATTTAYTAVTDASVIATEEYFICLSWSDDDKISLFVYNLTQDDYSFEEHTGSENYARYNGFSIFQLGTNLTGADAILDTQYANWIFDTGTYLSAAVAAVADQNAVQNLANRMPLTELGMIGYNWNTTVDDNIDIGDIESLDYDDHFDWIGYSKVNGVSFPDKFIKKCAGEVLRIIPVPSYLRGQTKYENSVIVFYRNGFNVFPLVGDPSTWNDSAENLIPERKRDGLVNNDTLAITPYGLLWQSESGLMLWNASEYKNVSYGRMDLPIKSTMKGIYLPLAQQYMLHDNAYTSESLTVNFQASDDTITLTSGVWDTSIYKVGTKIFISDAVDTGNNTGLIIKALDGAELTTATALTDETADNITVKTTKSWVYDIPDDSWVTFSGLDILYGGALSGGSTDENWNIFLDSYNEINKYLDYDQSKTEILATATKVFNQFYADYEYTELVIEGTGTVDFKSTDTQNSNTKEQNDETINNYKVNQLGYGMFGESLEIKVKNADDIHNVIVAYNPRNTRR